MLAQVLPPFVFSCDFTHQLGREGPRKPLQPAFGALERVPGGSPGLQTSSLSPGRRRRLRTQFLGAVTVLIDGIWGAGKGTRGGESSQPTLHV